MVVFPLVPVTPATRSFAVGSPQKRTADLGHRRAGIGDAGLGHRQVEEPLDDQRRGAGFDRQAAEIVAVRALSRNAEEEGARLDAATVVGKAGDLHLPIPGDLGDLGVGEQLAEVHRGDSRALATAGLLRPLGGRAGGGRRGRRSLLVRRDLEVGQRELGDLAEGRGGDHAAVVVALRLVDDHRHQQLGILRPGRSRRTRRRTGCRSSRP